MKRSVREVLAQSHVAAVTVAVLVFVAFNASFSTVWPHVLEAITFVATAIAILDVPYFSTEITSYDKVVAFRMCTEFYTAVVAFSAAWVLSKWVYGVGPLRCLSEYRKRLLEGRNA